VSVVDAVSKRTMIREIARIGDTFTRRRPSESTVDGETVLDYTANVVTGLKGIVALRTGRQRDRDWGQTIEGSHVLTAPGCDIQERDRIDVTSGDWNGRSFRIVAIDPSIPQALMERVHQGNQ
jgi:hypothetical protein